MRAPSDRCRFPSQVLRAESVRELVDRLDREIRGADEREAEVRDRSISSMFSTARAFSIIVPTRTSSSRGVSPLIEQPRHTTGEQLLSIEGDHGVRADTNLKPATNGYVCLVSGFFAARGVEPSMRTSKSHHAAVGVMRPQSRRSHPRRKWPNISPVTESGTGSHGRISLRPWIP